MKVRLFERSKLYTPFNNKFVTFSSIVGMLLLHAVRTVFSFPCLHKTSPIARYGFCVLFTLVALRVCPLIYRRGDRVVATSATLGDGLWEKNTLDGVLSAVGTRLVFSDTVTLRVERPLEAQQLAAARSVACLHVTQLSK